MQVRLMAIMLVAAMAMQASEGRAQSARSLGRKGNAFYEQERVKDAIEAYRQALALDPSSVVLQYNLGTAYARNGDLHDARTALGQAAEAPRLPYRQDAYFNLGVALAEQGISEAGPLAQDSRDDGSAAGPGAEGIDLQAAVDHLEEGLRSFRQSILVDPADLKAKYNYELTQEIIQRLKQEQQRQQQQNQNQHKQQEQQQQQDKQDENQSGGQPQQKQDPPNRQPENQDQPQNDPPNSPGQPTPTPTPQPSGSSQDSSDAQDPPNQPQNPAMTPGQMDAQRILNLLEEDKPDQFKRLLQYRGKPRERTLDRDW